MPAFSRLPRITVLSAGCRSLRAPPLHPSRFSAAVGAAATPESALAAARRFHGNHGDKSKPIKVHFTLPDGTPKDVVAYEGQNLLDVAMENELPMEGACAGSCACSTCHVYIDDAEKLDSFPEPTDEENDMIDQAFYPEPGSRLGCQCVLNKDKHDGLCVRMPRATRNMYVDGAKVTPHH